MSLPETRSGPAGARQSRSGLTPTAKILEFKQALQQRTGAMGGWAQDRAGAVRSAAERRPFAIAGLTAGVALIGGFALGMLLSGKMGGLKQTFVERGSPLTARARSMLRM